MQAEINNKVILSSSSSTREEAMMKVYDAPRGESGEGSPFKICLPPQSQPQPQSGMREQQNNTIPTSKMNVCAFDLSCLAQHDPNLPPSKLPFAWKLYEMLETVHRGNNQIDTNIVSWVDNGTAFKVHKLQQFVDKIVPTYFKQTKYKSFQRQLYFYGFQRVSSSSSSSSSSTSSSEQKQKRGQQQTKTVGSYRHPMFVRGNKTLCLSMVPKKNKSSKSSSKIKSFVGTSTATATATATTTATTVTTSVTTAAKKTNKKLKELKQQKQNQPQRSQQSDETETRHVRPRSPGRISMESNDDVVVIVKPIIKTVDVINTTNKDNYITTSTAPVLDDEPIPLLRRVDHYHHHHSNHSHQTHHVNKITDASFVDRQEQLQRQQREEFYRDLGLQDIHQPQSQSQSQSQSHQWQPQMNQQHQHHHHQQQQQQQQQRHRQCSRDDNEKACCIFGGKTFHFL